MSPDDETIVGLKAFHGHLGPYAQAGLRMGLYALRKLGAERHFGVEADVYCPDKPPPSCCLDGVQFSTGCTLGKRNIRHHVAEGVRACFRNRKTGQSLWLRLRPEAIGQAVERMRQQGDEAGAAAIRAMSDEDLMEGLDDR